MEAWTREAVEMDSGQIWDSLKGEANGLMAGLAAGMKGKEKFRKDLTWTTGKMGFPFIKMKKTRGEI